MTSTYVLSIVVPIVLFVGLVFLYFLYSLYRYLVKRDKLKKAKAVKQQQWKCEIDGSIGSSCYSLLSPFPSDDEKSILSLSASELIHSVRSSSLSASVVITAYIKQALRIHNQFNALTEMNFISALQQAKQLDSIGEQEKKKGFPLLGLPISLKDSVNIKGKDSTLGLVRYVNEESLDDALIVKVLKKAGAIIYTKTNIPQTLLSFECSNPLFGRSCNVFNRLFTPGGSSGGEASLIAGGGSTVGIGTDIGGSVRIPAHFSGNAAIKTTSRRISTVGFRPAVPGQEAVPGVAGLLGNKVNDLVLVLRELLCPAVWEMDSDAVPLPFDNEEYEKKEKMKIGYYIEDDFIPPSPACKRAVMEAVTKLEADGHLVKLVKPPSVQEGILLYYSLLACDGGKTVTNQLVDEFYEDYVKTIVTAATMNPILKQSIAALLRYVIKEEKGGKLIAATGKKTVEQTWKLQYLRKKYRQEWMEWWAKQENQFDCLLTPAHVLPAVPHGSYKTISFTCSFTMLFNVLDWPAGVVPVTCVETSDRYEFPPNSLLEKRARKCYKPQHSKGLPVGIQVVALPYRDEKVLRCMNHIERLVMWKKPPVQAADKFVSSSLVEG